jgi:hypothetical protein
MTQHCCAVFGRNIEHRCKDHPNPFDCPDSLLTQFKDGSFGLIVHDGGSSAIKIAYCPWCGKKLSKV